MEQSDNTKRIAKNTIYLYFRMLLLMVVSFYTSRVILAELGVEDYGIYNVVGGVVSMLGVLNSSLSGANSRFLAAAIGKQDIHELNKVMSCVKFIHWCLAAIVFFLAETIGLWFVYNKLVIPDTRIEAALYCYHLSVITIIISMISIPYNSLIIAREKMNAFAYISIFDALLRLLIVFLLEYQPYDKLIAFGFLTMLIQISIRLIYAIYCGKHFEESKIMPTYSKKFFRKIFNFSSYSLIGNLSCMFYNQGLSILLNMFFGPIVNAARAISQQVQGGCSNLVVNFQMAVQPQITKTWVNKEVKYNHMLITYSSRFSFYLSAIMVFPILYVTEDLLSLWLVTVPEYTIPFVRIALLCALIESFQHEMVAAIHATGEIAKFHIWEGCTLLTVLPASYICLRFLNVNAKDIMWVYFFIQLITQYIRIKIVLPQIGMPFRYYMGIVLIPILLPIFFYTIPIFLTKFINISSTKELFVFLLLGLFYTCFITYIFGLKKNEKQFVKKQLYRRFRKYYSTH